jgi:hypothetical protein
VEEDGEATTENNGKRTSEMELIRKITALMLFTLGIIIIHTLIITQLLLDFQE